MILWSTYGGLFLVAFLAATILPLQSEAVLTGLLLSGDFSPAGLLMVASCGNILGALINWWLGQRVERLRHKSWFPVSQTRLTQAQCWYARYGRWSLLLAWMPVIGDPLTVAAGVMREPFWPFLILAGSGKIARYLVLAALTIGWWTP